MLFLVSLASLLFSRLSSAQILSLGLQNGQIGTPVLQNFNQNVQRTINLPSSGIVLQNNGFNTISNLNSGIGTINTGIGKVNGLQLNSVPVGTNVQVVQNLPVTGIVTNGNIGNSNLITNLANNNLIANVGNNFGSNIVSANLVNSNVGTVSGGANWVNANVPVNLANGFNINTGTFAVGNTGLGHILPNGQPCGIQILADALEVGGAVGVNGQLPFYTTVNVHGSLPSSGVGVVNCGCGGQGV